MLNKLDNSVRAREGNNWNKEIEEKWGEQRKEDWEKRSLDKRFDGSGSRRRICDRGMGPRSSGAGFHEAYMIELYVN